MGDTRIKVASDKAELVQSLRANDDNTSPFQSYADVLVFAAALGMSSSARHPIQEYSKKIDPIRQDVFQGKGYEQVINLISIADTNDPKLVTKSEEAERLRIKIFEEYANAGLEILEHRLKGFSSYTECVLLILNELHQDKQGTKEDEFDLSSFL